MTSTATSGVLNSTDGTPIAWTRQGNGPPIVMVSGVMASRARPQQPALAAALAARYTAYTYDRRGTGESPTTSDYAVEREFEDMNRIIDMVGDSVAVYGFSSGATLALLNAAHGARISQLLLVEPPLVPDPDLGPLHEARTRLETDRADARRWFDEEITGIPAEIRAQFPPLTPADLANTPTMLHELTFLPGTAAAQFSALRVPTLLLASDHTAPVLLEAVRALGSAIPNATARVLPGHWHGIADDAIVDAIVEFLHPFELAVARNSQ
jgi:pimeloyl-ACP methyl ester carboxylesterase